MSDWNLALQLLAAGPKYADDIAESLHPGRDRISPSRGGPSGAQVAGNMLLGKLRARGWVVQGHQSDPGPRLWFITPNGRGRMELMELMEF